MVDDAASMQKKLVLIKFQNSRGSRISKKTISSISHTKSALLMSTEDLY